MTTRCHISAFRLGRILISSNEAEEESPQTHVKDGVIHLSRFKVLLRPEHTGLLYHLPDSYFALTGIVTILFTL